VYSKRDRLLRCRAVFRVFGTATFHRFRDVSQVSGDPEVSQDRRQARDAAAIALVSERSGNQLVT
jgi:hypothetical protein